MSFIVKEGYMRQILHDDVALFILRLSGLGLAVAHGWIKISALATGGGEQMVAAVASLGFPMPYAFAWAAGSAELIGGGLLAIGLFTRSAAFFVGFTMIIASFMRHQFLQQILLLFGLIAPSTQTIEGWGSPERAMLYLLVCLALLILGPGRLSLDYLSSSKKR